MIRARKPDWIRGILKLSEEEEKSFEEQRLEGVQSRLIDLTGVRWGKKGMDTWSIQTVSSMPN